MVSVPDEELDTYLGGITYEILKPGGIAETPISFNRFGNPVIVNRFFYNNEITSSILVIFL